MLRRAEEPLSGGPSQRSTSGRFAATCSRTCRPGFRTVPSASWQHVLLPCAHRAEMPRLLISSSTGARAAGRWKADGNPCSYFLPRVAGGARLRRDPNSLKAKIAEGFMWGAGHDRERGGGWAEALRRMRHAAPPRWKNSILAGCSSWRSTASRRRRSASSAGCDGCSLD